LRIVLEEQRYINNKGRLKRGEAPLPKIFPLAYKERGIQGER
jgi:hypothetical protein